MAKQVGKIGIRPFYASDLSKLRPTDPTKKDFYENLAYRQMLGKRHLINNQRLILLNENRRCCLFNFHAHSK
jgi:hypothetical protein